jgi:hypothetical protein
MPTRKRLMLFHENGYYKYFGTHALIQMAYLLREKYGSGYDRRIKMREALTLINLVPAPYGIVVYQEPKRTRKKFGVTVDIAKIPALLLRRRDIEGDGEDVPRAVDDDDNYIEENL